MLKASSMCRLSVNVNKLATLRNSRGKNNPDVAAFSKRILEFGVTGLTVHPRPDGRHIRHSDVEQLHALIQKWNAGHTEKVEYNIEGYPSPDFVQMMRRYTPDQATLVPDPPEALTSNAGWDLVKNEDFLHSVVKELAGIRVSLFVDPFAFDLSQEQALTRIRPARIELYTEKFADAFGTPEQAEVTARYRAVADIARKHNIGVNAGHDLNQDNLAYLVQQIPWTEEVSIGHALICEALEQGMKTTLGNYLRILKHADSHAHSSQR